MLKLTKKNTDLHVHIGGSLNYEQFIALAAPFSKKINWDLYLNSYLKNNNNSINIAEAIDKAANGGKYLQDFKELYICSDDIKGNFNKFQTKFNLIISLFRYYHNEINRLEDIISLIIKSHKKDGLVYMEYRAMCDLLSSTYFFEFHVLHARSCLQHTTSDFTAKYIPGIPRENPIRGINLLFNMLMHFPELKTVVVGVDFCHVEEGFPPSGNINFFKELDRLNQKHHTNIKVVYHVGESFYDKTLQSSIRWCHEAFLLGAKRIGHAIVLGTDPAVLLNRGKNIHLSETVYERICQIDYDIKYGEQLEEYNIQVDKDKLIKERNYLERKNSADIIYLDEYNEEAIYKITMRQKFVLDQLKDADIIIESCPSSNYLIGNIPYHQLPINKFIDSGVNFIIGTDDPGLFDTSLTKELDIVLNNNGISEVELLSRMGPIERYLL